MEKKRVTMEMEDLKKGMQQNADAADAAECRDRQSPVHCIPKYWVLSGDGCMLLLGTGVVLWLLCWSCCDGYL